MVVPNLHILVISHNDLSRGHRACPAHHTHLCARRHSAAKRTREVSLYFCGTQVSTAADQAGPIVHVWLRAATGVHFLSHNSRCGLLLSFLTCILNSRTDCSGELILS